MKKYFSIVLTMIVLFLCIFSFNKYQNQVSEAKEMWRREFEYVIQSIELFHPEPYKYSSRKELESEFDDLLNKVNDLTDDQIAFEVGRILALLRDGHTLLSNKYTRSEVFYPLTCQIINGELYIVDGIPKYSNLVNSRVISLNGYKSKEIIEKLKKYFSAENSYFKEAYVETRILNPRILNYMGVINESFFLELELECNSEYYSEVVEVRPYNDMNLYYEEKFKKSSKKGVREYNYEYLEDDDVIILTINSSYENEKLPIGEFYEDMWSFIKKNNVENLVIDLSNNKGGYTEITDPLVDKLMYSDFDKNNNIYVVIGNRNYSAGTVAASQLKRYTTATLIGEPTGGAPIMNYDAVTCISPNRKIEFDVSTDTFVAHPDLSKKTLEPDIFITKTIEDYINSNNPYLDYVLSNE